MGQCCTSCSSRNSNVSSLPLELTFDLPNSLIVKSDENSVEPLVKTTYNTFVELFLINRILFDCTDKQDYKPSLILEDILSHLPDNEEQQQYYNELKNILLLLSKHGLKKYLGHYYQDSHCKWIEIIFKHIVMTRYIDQYTKHTTISVDCDNKMDNIANNESSNKHKNNQMLPKATQNMEIMQDKNNNNNNNDTTMGRRLVFNQNDLVPRIFQYLEIIDLNECSIVSFIWLFHAFNINSLYYLQLYKLIELESKLEHNGRHLPLRVWQRFVNVRKILYKNSGYTDMDDINTKETSKHFLTYFGSLKNIENVQCIFRNVSETNVLCILLEVLAKRSHKTRHFCASLLSSSDNVIETFADILAKKPTLQLFNCESVRLNILQLPLILSNKCEQLSYELITINKAMSDALINESDLTGIKNVTLKHIRISPITNIDSDIKTKYDKHVIVDQKKEEIAKKLAQHMSGLRVLNIIGPMEDTMILWKELNTIVVKNNGDVRVSFEVIYIDARKEEMLNCYLDMLTFVVNNKIKVTTGTFSMNEQSLQVTKKAFETKEIVENVEVLELIGYGSQYMNNQLSINVNSYQYIFSKDFKIGDFKDEIGDDDDCRKYLKDCDYFNYSEDRCE